MDRERYSRMEMLVGAEAVDKLRGSHVLVCGIGGVLLLRDPLILAAGTGKVLGLVLILRAAAGLIQGGKVSGRPLRHALGEGDPPLPAYGRIPLARGSHHARDRGRSKTGNLANAQGL